MSDYTPTTDDIMRGFVAPPYKVHPRLEGEDFGSYLGRMSIESMHSQIASEGAARRWLVEHDRQVAEKAWNEGKESALEWCGPSSEPIVPAGVIL